jgi:hypothetical protein
VDVDQAIREPTITRYEARIRSETERVSNENKFTTKGNTVYVSSIIGEAW